MTITVSTQTDGQSGIIRLSQVVYHIKKLQQDTFLFKTYTFSNLKLLQNSITHTANDIKAHMNNGHGLQTTLKQDLPFFISPSIAF